ncbi:thiamine diphosphokinase [Sporosalibacterium faouarense]|uniref:thiamine diphosphokinase n=1 Tax=Sporosalibacterium faouarense TaxID=516123 RepID=UPI00141C1BFA|nr:thiamine diphosphokinase [Sporosalibacterium faouarense]MTI47717.1 thiamine diphosphokinase [Bacillota bacterium]
MKTLIISNGTIEDTNILNKFIDESDYVICADGGARHFYKTEFKPSVIVGDFDSLNSEILLDMRNKEIELYQFPAEKDMTDTELAIDLALKRGATDITLLGGTGSRLDHTIGNIMIMKKFVNIDANIKIVNSNNEIFITKDKLILDRQENTFVSVIPITEVAKGVTLRGFKYETNDIDFRMDETLGISNEIINEKGIIEIREGICLVIISKD